MTGSKGKAALRAEELEKKLAETENALMNMLSDLNAANQKVVELDRAKDAFVGMTAHELRTPLTPLKAQLQMLRAGIFGRLNRRQKAGLDTALRDVDREINLVTDILTVSKLEAGKQAFDMKPMDVAALLPEAERIWKPQARAKGLSFELRAGRALPKVLGDRLRLGQVLGVFLNNALAFTDRGGITMEARGSMNGVVVSVTDTGGGIPREAIRKIFTKFYQADASRSRAHGGSGLGLAIAKGIIEAHGGEIGVESEPGKGTRFFFLLPRMKKGKG